MAQDGQTSINIPQILAVAVVGFLAIRWFMSKPAGSATSGSSSTRRQNIDPRKIEQVSAVFPQLDQRTIAWDLHRNGGNVEATMERVLSGRGLETPPPTFQPALPPAPTAQRSTQSANPSKKASAPMPDLISRYNLQNRVNGKGKEAVPSEEKRTGWSVDKSSRAEALRYRREEMILAARRKMQERDQQAQS